MKRLMLAAVACFTLLVPTLAQDTTSEADLTAIKTYLLENVNSLQSETTRLQDATTTYYTLAESVGFDYAKLWADHRLEVGITLLTAKDAWLKASPLYEQVEGVVAGVPSMAKFDVLLDAGASGEEDPEGGVTFDLNLKDGRVLARPGNLFGILESTLWGTREDFSSSVLADLNLNNEADFGEKLPDANVLLASAETMNAYATDLVTTANAWEPTSEDAFTALVTMVPTMSEYFAAWRDSRFIAGDDATLTDFVVISRLSDIKDILGGLIVVYDSVSPQVSAVDAAQDEQIKRGLSDLREYVLDLYAQELAGKRFTAEDADLYGTEAQSRAQAITGQITQVAALLNITLPE